MRLALFAIAGLLTATATHAAPVTYKIDPDHTYPSFEADHLGISVWRGKFNKSSGTVHYDKATGTGDLDVTVLPASIDYGQDALNKWAQGKDLFDVKKHPKVVYRGRFDKPVDGVPTEVTGELTMHGVTKPVTLKLNWLRCMPHPMLKREMCGADAVTTIRRDEFGMDVGKDYKFNMDVTLRIQVEAIAGQ
ncbi:MULTISPECIES: YceI family protein [unclassified Rhizobacter]|uniref:YceI family protein n=1 Tax=unclassified Rhizobacter TaxID=2640088 RepID=UPI0006F9267D|nr:MULTISPECIES: YceI family protein [unclassified Rhizobacter]KQU81476.1 polyisoprenoid-binding protein [Rhizobacter sp. Root29]KQW12194.1 polyisoprenoid-binding protein [Rhizobacter sp. Root1238]KRB03009.1 polyisoprenoid-binding protein [Rhizobacter sp. Root16D2]